MPNNKAEIEALIANSPVFQNAAGKTDSLLGTDIKERADKHIQDLSDADARATALESFTPNGASTASKGNLFEQPALKNAFVDPTPSERSKQVRDQTLGAFENIDALVDHSKDWAKPQGFNTGANDIDYDRYYYHPNFKKLGYSPFRDNESLYNANSSWWDDFTRMRSQWMGLAGEGFMSMVEQWKNPLDFSPNTEMGKSFEKGMAIAASTKPGFGAKFTNFVGNSAYTVGILADMVGEEAVLLGATALTGGLDAEVTVPGMAGTIARGMMKLTKGSKYLEDILKTYKREGELRKTMSGVNTAEKARDIFTTARQYGAATVDFLNPLKNTMGFMKTAAGEARVAVETGKNVKKLTNLALVSRGVGSFYKDVRMMNAAFAEARLEGGMVKNEKLKDWVGEYYNKNGKLPEGEEADRLNIMATDAGVKTSLINIPMIYYTNELVLGKAFKGWIPTSVAREMEAGTKGVRFLKNKGVYQGVEGIKKFGKSAYWKQAPTIIAADMLRYTSANFAEGAQETIQDVISTGVKDYYDKIYHSPALAGHRQSYASFTKGVGSQFSDQGAETFLSGFFMGALLQGPQNLIYTHGRTAAMAAGEKIVTGKDADGKPKYAVTPGTLEKVRKEKADWINHVQTSLNAVAQNPEEFAKALELNMTRQTNLYDTMNRAISDKDRKTFEDGKSESMFQHFYTLMQSGHFENLIQELESLKSLKPEELAEAFNEKLDDKDVHNKSMHERLDKIVARAYQVKNHYEEINSRYTEDIDPYQFDPVKEPAQFKNMQRRKVAFREAKMHAAFGDYAYNDALERITSITRDAIGVHKPLTKASSNAISILFDPFRSDGSLSMEIKSLRKQAETFKGSTPENEAQVPKIREKVKALTELQRKIKKYDSLFQLQRKGAAVPEAVIAESESAVNDLHNGYREYLKLLADETGESLLDKNIPNSFSGLVDFIELNRESKNMARFINHLHDPENFLKYVDTFDDELAKQLEKWYKTNKEALTKYIGRQDMNTFINILFDRGAFLSPESIDNLANHKYNDLEFVNATTGGPIEKTSDKYINEIKPLVDLFIDVQTEKTAEPAISNIVDKIVKGEKLTSEEEDTRRANAQAVEDELKERQKKASLIEPTREQAQASSNLLSGIEFHLKGGIVTSYNATSKKWDFKNRNGKIITNRKRIEKLSTELANKPGIVRVWWKEQINNEDRDFIRKDFDQLYDIYQSGATHQSEFIQTPEFIIMESLQGAKFKTGSDVDKNTTDINKKAWIADDGSNIDQFSEIIMDDLAEVGAANLDESDIINSIYDLVNRYPEGIKKKDLVDYQEQNNDTKNLIALSNLFAHTYGLDIQTVYNKLTDLNILDYESKTKAELAPAPTNITESTRKEDLGISTEEPPIQEEVYTGEPEIGETEVVTEIQDSDEIKVLRDAAAAKVEDPAEKLDILMGKRDSELMATGPTRVEKEVKKEVPKEKPIVNPAALKKGDIIVDFDSKEEFTVVAYYPESGGGYSEDDNVHFPPDPAELVVTTSKGKEKRIGDDDWHNFYQKPKYKVEPISPVIETPSVQEQYKEAVASLEWARENNDEDGIIMYRAIIEDLRLGMSKKEKVEPITKVSAVDQIVKAESLKALISVRTKIFRDALQDLNYFKNITASEIEKLYNAKLESLIKSVTFANISKDDYLIMSDRKAFPTGVGLVKYKGKDYIQVRAITESGTPDPFSSIEVSEKNLVKAVKNIYSEAVAKEATSVPVTVDKQTEVLSDDSIKENKDMSTDEKKAIISDAKKQDLNDLKNNLFKNRC